MIEFVRVRRRPVIAGGMFLGGVLVSANALGQASDIPDLGQYLGLALQAVVGLVGLLGPVLMLLRSLMQKRERLVRGDLADRVAALESRLDEDERALGLERGVVVIRKEAPDDSY